MRSLMAISLLVSTSAFACPNLAGIYKNCQAVGTQDDSVSELAIDQKLVNKFHQFTFTTKEAGEAPRVETYTADGKSKIQTETDPDSGISMKTSTLSTCTSSDLNIKVKVSMDTEVLADLTITTTKDGKKLIQKMSGTSMGEPLEETVICE